MNEKIYTDNGRVCIERKGGKMWFNIDTLNNLIAFHERELKSLYEAKRHLTQQCSGQETPVSIFTTVVGGPCRKCGKAAMQCKCR